MLWLIDSWVFVAPSGVEAGELFSIFCELHGFADRDFRPRAYHPEDWRTVNLVNQIPKRVRFKDLFLVKGRGGKKPVWHAYHPSIKIIGYGNSADNAIKDFQSQFRKSK